MEGINLENVIDVENGIPYGPLRSLKGVKEGPTESEIMKILNPLTLLWISTANFKLGLLPLFSWFLVVQPMYNPCQKVSK